MENGVVRRPPFGSNPLVGERGSDTRRRILAAALEVFGEVAFAEARVELITERAGCSRPAFYQYFSSKDEVFWELATQLGREMVGLAEQLGSIGADAEGVAHLVTWVDAFMALHEDWAPIFNAYPAATRDHADESSGSSTISERTALALLKAFGARATAANKVVAQSLVAMIIRCSFYAEHAPKGTDRTPMATGLARIIHRTFCGPIEGVNVTRSRPTKRVRVKVVEHVPADPGPELRPRGERTRRQLLDAGAAILPARGYHETKVDDIVTAAGVSHGTFYRYFEHKDDFFRVLAESAGTRMIELVDRLALDAPPDDLRAWLGEWFDAYQSDGGVISTWQEMRASPELAAFSQQVAASVFTRLERALAARDFGQPPVAASTLLALVERGPYAVYTLRFTARDAAIEAMVTIIRRGFLALQD